MKHLVLECEELKSVIELLLRFHFSDLEIDNVTKLLFKKEVEDKLNSYLGLKEHLIEDDDLWVYEECCDYFESIFEKSLCKDIEHTIVSVRVINLRGDILITHE